MLAKSIITTLSVAELDIGHRLGINRKIAIGAAVLTAQLEGSRVHFRLDSLILQPSDTADTLLSWLDEHLTNEGATITGYQLGDAAALLDRLPGAGWSPSLRALAGCGQQRVLNLSATREGAALTLQQACAESQILCAPIDPNRRFAAWVRSDTDEINRDVQINAIATFRLVIGRLAALDRSQGLANAISAHFAAWLDEADHSAARLHVADLLSVTG